MICNAQSQIEKAKLRECVNTMIGGGIDCIGKLKYCLGHKTGRGQFCSKPLTVSKLCELLNYHVSEGVKMTQTQKLIMWDTVIFPPQVRCSSWLLFGLRYNDVCDFTTTRVWLCLTSPHMLTHTPSSAIRLQRASLVMKMWNSRKQILLCAPL